MLSTCQQRGYMLQIRPTRTSNFGPAHAWPPALTRLSSGLCYLVHPSAQRHVGLIQQGSPTCLMLTPSKPGTCCGVQTHLLITLPFASCNHIQLRGFGTSTTSLGNAACHKADGRWVSLVRLLVESCSKYIYIISAEPLAICKAKGRACKRNI